MPDSDQNASSGHRARLRQRFAADPTALSDVESLELILTFATPRLDVAPQARALLDRFGSPAGVLAATYHELLGIVGIGEQTTLFLQAVGRFAGRDEVQPVPSPAPDQGERALPLQATLFAAETAPSPDRDPTDDDAGPEPSAMRAFVNDEAANALAFLPQAARFPSVVDFKTCLGERLPYNPASTRRRRANYMRILPDNLIADNHLSAL
jgi:hypothetical protein